ncbi:hypothetical protein HML84_21740 [Alcanivorax sp. IO_7]|nr:hypothetical protein HML84_21740 [Alcanivorax sp. IO_7]
MVFAAVLLLLPFVFQGNSTAFTLLNVIGINIVFALSYNMLLGQGACCPSATRCSSAWAATRPCTP